jgi:hypothetical protein
VVRTPTQTYPLPGDDESVAFARSLAADLRAVGIRASVKRSGSHTRLFLPKEPLNGFALNPGLVREAQVKREGGRRGNSRRQLELTEGPELELESITPPFASASPERIS